MKTKIERVVFPTMNTPKITKTAAYCRVSSEKDSMLHSLSAQVGYYNDLIQKTPGWTFAGIFADEAKTGTKDNRPGWQELLQKCRNGEVDMIITKSISRFSRNTIDCLSAVRELKEAGVDVYFEEQRIHSLSGEGELMLTVLASFAQEESRSCSENQKWRIRKEFLEGKPWNGRMLGYKKNNGGLVIVPEEAETVRRIFEAYLNGKGFIAIANELNKSGTKKWTSSDWHFTAIDKILKNPAYMGCLLLQRTFRENHITKKKRDNKGELPKYRVEDAHEAIVSKEMFAAVQAERERRRQKFKGGVVEVRQPTLFTHRIKCPYCGAYYRRKTTASGVVWICQTFNTIGKSACPFSKQIPEQKLIEAVCGALDTTLLSFELIDNRIRQIEAYENNLMRIELADGETKEVVWKDRSRAESWTDEMKEAARKKALERSKAKCLR